MGKAEAPKITMMDIANLKFAREAPKGLNLVVRRSNDSHPLSDAELEATIRQHGVIIPMVVKMHDGVGYVTSGNRRLRLVRKVSTGATSPTMVPTFNSDDYKGDPRELALATNVSLPPHPVDRYEVIAMLVKDGMTPEDAKLRFGMGDKQFRQTMRLGTLSPLVREKWRDGSIDAKTAQAFALSDDQKEQDKVYEAALKASWSNPKRVQEHEVRSRLVGAAQRDIGRYVAFVGVEACRAAKILKQEDLFATNHTVTDTKALQKLVTAKLNEKIAELTADGWAWALSESDLGDNRHYYSSIQPAGKPKATEAEKAELNRIENLLREDDGDSDLDFDGLEEMQTALTESINARGYTADQRKKSGCVLKISSDGSLNIEYGRVKPEERKKVEASERRASPAAKAKAKKKAALKPGEATLTNALAERLSKQLQNAMSETLKREPAAAVAGMIAAFASDGHALDIHVGRNASYNPNKKSLDFNSVFEGALKASVPEQMMMLAQVAAQAVDIVVHRPDKMPLDDKGIAALCGAIQPSAFNKAIAAAFDAKDYFASVSREAIFQAVREAMGDDHATNVAKMDKATAAKFAAANVPITGWLPAALRTVHYKPVQKFTGKVAEPTPAKKAAGKPTAKKAAKKKAKK